MICFPVMAFCSLWLGKLPLPAMRDYEEALLLSNTLTLSTVDAVHPSTYQKVSLVLVEVISTRNSSCFNYTLTSRKGTVAPADKNTDGRSRAFGALKNISTKHNRKARQVDLLHLSFCTRKWYSVAFSCVILLYICY